VLLGTHKERKGKGKDAADSKKPPREKSYKDRKEGLISRFGGERGKKDITSRAQRRGADLSTKPEKGKEPSTSLEKVLYRIGVEDTVSLKPISMAPTSVLLFKH